MARIVKRLPYVTRAFVRKNSNCVFLFGDNLQGSGFGGQAKQMRGEPNAISIPTKKKPSMESDAFFTDDEFEDNKVAIDNAFSRVPDYVVVYIPERGIGTGLAMLPTVAPKTYDYILKKLEEL